MSNIPNGNARQLPAWEQRPLEVAYLLNPAFCAEIIRRCVRSYEKTGSSRFSYPLTFLILPILLHEETRSRMPKTSKKQLHTWLHDNQDIRIGFAERTNRLVPITRESLLFLLQVGAVEMDATAHLTVSQDVDKDEKSIEVKDHYRKAKLLGQWFARSGTEATIFSMLGVKP